MITDVTSQHPLFVLMYRRINDVINNSQRKHNSSMLVCVYSYFQHFSVAVVGVTFKCEEQNQRLCISQPWGNKVIGELVVLRISRPSCVSSHISRGVDYRCERKHKVKEFVSCTHSQPAIDEVSLLGHSVQLLEKACA